MDAPASDDAHDAGGRPGQVRLRRGAAPRPDRSARDRRQGGARAGARGRSRPRHLAPDDRQALPAAPGVRPPPAEEPGARAATSPAPSWPSAPRSPGSPSGDEVFGIAPGSFAEYAVAREDKLAPQAGERHLRAGRGGPGLRADRAAGRVATSGGSSAGQKVLVIGASGGVGSYAVQMAKALGAEVTGVASAAKLDLVRSLGADHVIDYTSDDFADGAQRYDVILDIAGNPTLSRLRRALTPRRNGRARRRRGGRHRDRRHGPAAPRPGALLVRPAAAGHGHAQGARQRHRAPRRAHRGRPGHPEHRPDLPAGAARRKPCATSRTVSSAASS